MHEIALEERSYQMSHPKVEYEEKYVFFPKKDTTLVLENAIRLNIQDIPHIPYIFLNSNHRRK